MNKNQITMTGSSLLLGFLVVVSGCHTTRVQETQDSFLPHYHVGDIYEVVGNVCELRGALYDGSGCKLAEWQALAEESRFYFKKLPLGTKIKIISIEKNDINPVETTNYYVHVNVLPNGHEDIDKSWIPLGASELTYGKHGERFGANGTLKLVYDASK